MAASFVRQLRCTAAFLFPFRLPAGAEHSDLVRLARWSVPLGLVIGLLYAGIYRAAWRCFGDVHGIRLMPAVCVWLADVVLCGSVLLLAAARVVDRAFAEPAETGGDSGRLRPGLMGSVGSATLVILCTLRLGLWVAIPDGVSTWPGVWGSALDAIYPHAFYRPLVLAPLWGRWGVVLANGIGRTAPDADAIVRRSGKRQSARVILAWFLPIAALTAVYCGYNAKWVLGCVLALAVLGATYLFSVLMALRLGGQTRDSILAAGFAAETSFLLFYTGLSVRIYAS